MKVAEIYASIQGEGPNVGQPTTFVRFGGCNLRCPGWGEGELPDGTKVRGCDTVFAVYPEFRDQWRTLNVDEIIGSCQTLNVTLTGGEPFIQRSKELNDLAHRLLKSEQTIDVFTNGTQQFPSWVTDSDVTLIVDYKLPGSGEYGKFNLANLDYLHQKDAIKFVCKDESDFHRALSDIAVYGLALKAQCYFGVVWDSQVSGEFTAARLAALIQGFAPYAKLNIQTHNLIWPAHERRR